jgi:hypothetical protein
MKTAATEQVLCLFANFVAYNYSESGLQIKHERKLYSIGAKVPSADI